MDETVPVLGDLSELEDLAAMAVEELHPDLVPRLYEGEYWGTILKHPLVFQIPHMNNGLANRAYAAKTRALERALEEKDWHSYVWLHERPYRFDALTTLITEHDIPSDDDMWKLVRDVWIDSENVWQHFDEWCELLSNEDSMLMMTTDELAEWNALDAIVPVYRGAKLEINEEGLSYTLSKERAEWFARRFANEDEPAVVIRASVPQHKIIALMHGRGEEEVLVLPEDVVINYYEEIN